MDEFFDADVNRKRFRSAGKTKMLRSERRSSGIIQIFQSSWLVCDEKLPSKQ